ncbi:MAG: hypothetical protein N3A01_04690 [Bacteroidales bacterium]|nr:hypothetical protein [Bacteroidales bacterium]
MVTIKFLILFILLTVYLSSFSQGKFSALMFGDYFYNIMRDDSISKANGAILKDEKNNNGFTYRRIHLTYDYKFNSKIFTRVNLESDNESTITNGKFGFFIKDAFIQFDSVYSNISISSGIITTPIYNISERWWGNRFLEKTITDLRRFASGRDLGVSVSGSFVDKKIFYVLMVGNNSGNKIETDRFKSIYTQVGYNYFDRFIIYSTFTYHFLPRIVDTYDTIPPISTLNNDRCLITLFAGFKLKNKISTGLELFIQSNNNSFNSKEKKKLENYYSYGGTFYISYSLSKLITLVERIDYFDPNALVEVNNDRSFYNIFAINIKIKNDITISPNILAEFYENLNNGYTLKPSITPRITLFWKY